MKQQSFGEMERLAREREDEYENAWSTLFGCVHQNRCPRRRDDFQWGHHTLALGTFDC